MKAARALLGLDQKALAELCGIAVNTIRNMEAAGNERVRGRTDTLDAVVSTFEYAGIEFLNHGRPGVRKMLDIFSPESLVSVPVEIGAKVRISALNREIAGELARRGFNLETSNGQFTIMRKDMHELGPNAVAQMEAIKRLRGN